MKLIYTRANYLKKLQKAEETLCKILEEYGQELKELEERITKFREKIAEFTENNPRTFDKFRPRGEIEAYGILDFIVARPYPFAVNEITYKLPNEIRDRMEKIGTVCPDHVQIEEEHYDQLIECLSDGTYKVQDYIKTMQDRVSENERELSAARQLLGN